jgi:hypothetical protein
MDGLKSPSRKESMEESVNSPHSQPYKSVRSGGGLFTKGMNQLSNANIENIFENKVNEVDPNINNDVDKNGYYLADQRYVSAKNLANNIQLNQSNTPYMNESNEEPENRPSLGDRYNSGLSKFDFKANRPSTSKPKNRTNMLRKGRTKVLSQEEYFELQNSEKKKNKKKPALVNDIKSINLYNHESM